jgi:hypothetical protein
MNKSLVGGMLLLAIPASIAAQNQPIDAKVAHQAGEISKAGKKKLPGGMSFDGAAAEGTTLVLKFSGIPDWRPGTTNAEMSKALGAPFCARPNLKKLVSEGARIRIDATSPGKKKLPPLPIC